MFWSMVKVRYRQDNSCQVSRVLVIAIGVILYTTEFTASMCPFKNGSSNLLPVPRIA
ncbi:hypothetical protein [Segatella oris]|uniref:hypothetical protein n=1 Tax=Segatella oris TaxID=28135 RepID=UPI0028D2A85E|nr:hypothetical protein [Segatella oris]